MSESVIHRNESDYPWELDPDDAHREARIRVRTFVSGGRTPTSGLSMGVFEMPPGALLDPHSHHPAEVYYVTAGEAEVYHGDRWRPLCAGDVVYFPADTVHGARNRGPAPCTIVWVFPADSYDEIEYFPAGEGRATPD
jgi:quercetin dioxygenase-like cupin family protein